MAAADLDAGRFRRDERDGDAEIFLVAEQVIGIVQLESEAQHGRDRAERDVALVPVQPHAEHLACPRTARADDAGVDHRSGIGAGFRTGQAEARNFACRRPAAAASVALLLGAEPHQQFARSERVRHHHRHRGGDRAASRLCARLRNAR